MVEGLHLASAAAEPGRAHRIMMHQMMMMLHSAFLKDALISYNWEMKARASCQTARTHVHWTHREVTLQSRGQNHFVQALVEMIGAVPIMWHDEVMIGILLNVPSICAASFDIQTWFKCSMFAVK